MDRRAFVRSSAGAAAGLCLGSVACGSGEAARADAEAPDGGARGGRAMRWGVQLYTLRALMAEDLEGTLAEVAAIGYREVEFAGYFDRSPAEVREALAAAGLSAPATHLPLDTFRNQLGPTLETAAAIGHEYLVLPWVDAEERAHASDIERLADELNAFGAGCAAAGARFAYHNQAYDLMPVGGAPPLRTLLERTEPDVVTFELDIYWAVDGGGDPLEYFETYPGRFELCHLKDRDTEGRMVDVGDGAIDFAAILGRAGAAGLSHYFVEHDTPEDPRGSVAASFRHLTALERRMG